MKPIINPRIERKLGRRLLAAIAEMGITPRTNIKRFIIVKKQLARAAAEYTRYTGRDTLDPNVDYGYHVR